MILSDLLDSRNHRPLIIFGLLVFGLGVVVCAYAVYDTFSGGFSLSSRFIFGTSALLIGSGLIEGGRRSSGHATEDRPETDD